MCVCVCVLQIATDLSLFICKNLGPTIRDVSSAAKDNNKRLAVDMAFEQRKAKCDAAKMVLDVSRHIHRHTHRLSLSHTHLNTHSHTHTCVYHWYVYLCMCLLRVDHEAQ